MTELLDLNQLLRLSLDRISVEVQCPFGNHTLTIKDPDRLPQRHKLMLSKAQGHLQDYFMQLIDADRDDKEKIKDKTLSAGEVAKIKQRMTQNAIALSQKLLNQNRENLDWNILYIEAVSELEPGTLMAILNEAMDELDEDRHSQQMPALSQEERDRLVPAFIARASQLIRSALDESEKNFQEEIVTHVKRSMNGNGTASEIDRLKALEEMESPKLIPELMSKERKPLFEKP